MSELEWLVQLEYNEYVIYQPDAFGQQAPVELRVQCARSSSAAVRGAVAIAGGLPNEIYRELAMDPEPQVRSAVARSPHAPPEALRLVAEAPNPDVMWLSANPHTPIDAVKNLAGTGRVVASDPDTPAATLSGLASDPDVGTRLQVTLNPSTPREVIAALARSEKDEHVLRAACGHRRDNRPTGRSL